MEKLQKTFFDAYSRHADEIFRFILFKVSDREKSKDMLQDVFMKTWVYMSRSGSIENMRAFLYKTASNRVIDEYRRQDKKESNLDSLESLSEDFGFDPPDENASYFGSAIDGEQALSLIKELPAIYSEVLYLRYAENQSVPEIAATVGETNNTISVRLSRGIQKLKELMADKGNPPTGGKQK